MTRMSPFLIRLRMFRRRGLYWMGALSMAAARVSFERRMGRPPRWARDEVTGRLVNELFDEALWNALSWEKHKFLHRILHGRRHARRHMPRAIAARRPVLRGTAHRRALWLNASLRAELEARFGRPCTDEELAIAILHGHRPAFMVRRA